jgi:hypothetical protein
MTLYGVESAKTGYRANYNVQVQRHAAQFA